MNIQDILTQHNLEVVDRAIFRDKDHVMRVKDVHGRHMIVKSECIDPWQIELLRIAKNMEHTLSFCVPDIVYSGDGWYVMEDIDGVLLNALYDTEPERCIAITKQISDDYQKIIAQLQNDYHLDGIYDGVAQWHMAHLAQWGASLVDADIVDARTLQKITDSFHALIAQRGNDLWGLAHGNIIGDHIIVAQGAVPYLLDLAVVPRCGNGYYDFLRALDFFFLRSSLDVECIMENIMRWMHMYVQGHEVEEVQNVFAFRMIGVAGWDIVHCKTHSVKGNRAEKIQKACVLLQEFSS